MKIATKKIKIGTIVILIPEDLAGAAGWCGLGFAGGSAPCWLERTDVV